MDTLEFTKRTLLGLLDTAQAPPNSCTPSNVLKAKSVSQDFTKEERKSATKTNSNQGTGETDRMVRNTVKGSWRVAIRSWKQGDHVFYMYTCHDAQFQVDYLPKGLTAHVNPDGRPK